MAERRIPNIEVRAVTQLRYCRVCERVTEQASLLGDKIWRCRKCETELPEKEGAGVPAVRRDN